MSNDIYKILNNFNKLIEQKPEPTQQAAKPKTQLQESIEQVDAKYKGFKSLNEMDKSQKSSDRGGESSGNPYAKGGKAKPVKSTDMANDALATLNKASKKAHKKGIAEGEVEESGLQAYLGKKKYGKEGMQALQQAGREGASKEKMAMIRAKHDRMDEEQLDEKAVSRAQQKFMGMVHAAKKGGKPASPEVAKTAKGMSKKAARDFAATKHKGLPQHVSEAIHRAFQNGYTKEEILESLNVILESDKDYWRELMKDVPKQGTTDRIVHKGHYGTEYQGDDDEDDDGQTKKKIAKPEGEKRGRGRPKGVKNRVVRAGEKKAAPSGEKRGRGRPAGSKNKVKESWIAENNQMIAEAFLHLVERQSDNRLPAPMEPTYIRDPKTGELVPDIDYKLNPQLKPAPAKPAPRPAPRQQQGPDKRSEVDVDGSVAEEQLDEKMIIMPDGSVEDRTLKLTPDQIERMNQRARENPVDQIRANHQSSQDTQSQPDAQSGSQPGNRNDEFKPKCPPFTPASKCNMKEDDLSEMMRLAGMEGQLHGKQHKLDVDRDGDIEADDLADLRSGRKKVKENQPVAPRNDWTSAEIVQILSGEKTQEQVLADREKSKSAPSQPINNPSAPKIKEDDMEEGNEFSGALAKAKASGAKEFKVDGKTYPVKESQLDECGDMGPMANGMSEQEGRMNVTTNMSTDGTKSVTVTADGDAALELMQILSLAGMKGQSTSMPEAEVTVVPMEEAKDDRYYASTTPEEDIIPLETQLQGGDGEVAGKTKKMNKHGSARFSDNPLAAKDIEESISLSLMKEYESIKVK